MIVLRLAMQSLRNRWFTAILTILAIALSVALLLGVEKIRTSAKQSFADTISGTDLIVGVEERPDILEDPLLLGNGIAHLLRDILDEFFDFLIARSGVARSTCGNNLVEDRLDCQVQRLLVPAESVERARPRARPQDRHFIPGVKLIGDERAQRSPRRV